VREVLFVREADHLGLATNVTSHLAQSTLSSVILKPTLSSEASKSRSSIATCQASAGRAKPMPHVSDGKGRAGAHVAANNRAQTAHIFWTGHAAACLNAAKNRPPQREGAAEVSEVG
jgi:hypothetical protein